MRFKGKVAIISGGGAGMGRGVALAFAKEGACVVINDIDEEGLNSAVDDIRLIGGTVTAVKGDVTRSEDVKALVTQALEQYGQVDILFNYVGGNPDLTPRSLFIEQTEDFWSRTIELNLKSTIILSRAVLDSMIKRNYGKIINTAAAAGLVGAETMVVYSAAKGGVIAFTKALARELAAHNINVNCICPGPIDTPGFAKMSPREERERAAAKTPLCRIGRPEEVASAVLFLASDDAGFITGQALAIDGGMTMV